MNEPQHFHEFMPDDVWKWKTLERKVDQVLALHDYEEIRLSVLQDYHVLYHGLTALMPTQEAKNVVEKTLNLCQPDSDISLISLRPEGTISVLHHTAGIYQAGEVHRFYYHGPMFRKSKQGRPMEFYQLGVELLGSESILSENEVISLGIEICQAIGLGDVAIRINSYGCDECRQPFFAKVRDHLDQHSDGYCSECFTALSANPFEDTRCDNESCRHRLENGPVISEFLCEKCQQNFSRIKKIQANLGHRYVVDPYLYKNFAYYNETVFDFVIGKKGEETVIGGGGRYDFLSERITGQKIPAVGFYLNMDTIFEVLTRRQLFIRQDKAFSVYLCAQSAEMEMMMLQIAHELQEQRIRTVIGTEIKSSECELSEARRKHCSILITIREDNIRDGKILMHNLVKDHQEYIQLAKIGEAVLLARKALKQD